MAMSGIEMLRSRNFELYNTKEGIKFEDNAQCRFIFDFQKKKVKTNIIDSSEMKFYLKAIEKIKNELGWEK